MSEQRRTPSKPVVLPPPPALSMENYGVDTIPDQERAYRPYHIIATMYGCNLSYSAIIFGSFPIIFGLSWWSSVTAIIVGSLIGGLVLSPMGLFGPRTGTNNAVSSGAHFGVAGRFIGTSIALFSALGFVSLTIWTGGDALSASVTRVTGSGGSDPWVRAIGYGVIAVIVLWVCIRGVHLVIRLQERVMAPIMSLVMLAGLFAFGPSFDASYAGSGDFAFGSFGAAWVASVLSVATLIVSYAGFIGDWARYIPKDTPPRRLVVATFLSGAILVIPILWGAFLAASFPKQADTFVVSLTERSPLWFLVGVLLLALLAGVAQGAIGLYGTGLDASSLIPFLSRPQATWLIAVVSTTIVYLGAFVWDALAVVNAFLAILLIVSGPWVIIMAIGYIHCRGYYYPRDLQVFTHGHRGGRYWFTHGWNWRSTTAWAVGSVVGCLFGTAEPIFTGPFAGSVGEIDISFVLALIIGGVLYLVFLLVSPSPGYIFGERGSGIGGQRSGEKVPEIETAVTAGILAREEPIEKQEEL